MSALGNIWAMVEAERLAVADLLDRLSPSQWDSASRCSGWRVRDVAAHVVALPTNRMPAMLLGVAKARFDIDRWLDHDARARAARFDPAQLVLELRRLADDRRTTPGIGGGRGPLADIIVHGADITEALGLAPIAHPAPHLVVALDFALGIDIDIVRRVVFRPKSSATGLRLVATDLDWSRGTGRDVEGSALDLLSALSGRPDAADRLVGDGAQLLRDAG